MVKLNWMMGNKALHIVFYVLLVNTAVLLSQEHNRSIVSQGEIHFLTQGETRITKIKKYSALSGKYLGVLTYLKEDHNYQYGLPWGISNDNYVAIHNTFRPGMGGSAVVKEYKIEKIDSLSLYNREKAEWDSLIAVYGGAKNAIIYMLDISDTDNIGREFIPFSKYLRRSLSSQSYSRDDLVDVRYDFALFGKGKRKGIIGFKTHSSFDKWEFNLDSISSMKKTFSIVPKIVDSIEYSDSKNFNEVDSSFLNNPFFIYNDEKGNCSIDYNSGNIYSIDDSIKYIGTVELYDDDLILLEDLDEGCLWVNGTIVWKNEGYKRSFIREIGDEYKRMMNEIRRQN